MLSLRFAYDYTPFYFMEHIYNEVIKNYDDGSEPGSQTFSAEKKKLGRVFAGLVGLHKQKNTARWPPTGMLQSPPYFMLMKWNFYFTCYRTCHATNYNRRHKSKQTRKSCWTQKKELGLIKHDAKRATANEERVLPYRFMCQTFKS